MSPSKIIGIMGGSLNPIHTAHLTMAETAHDSGLDEVWLMPTLQNRLKLVTGMESFEHRYGMCRIAAQGRESWLKVSNFEQAIQENRTLHVLRHLQREHPDYQFVFLMGSDCFAQLPEWYGWRELIQEFSIAVFNRPDQCEILMATEAAKEFSALYKSDPKNLRGGVGWTILDHDPIALSATEIRRSLCENRTTGGVVPGVLKYIQVHDLYLKDKWYVPEIKESDIESLAISAGVAPTLYDRDNIYVGPDASPFQECDELIKFTGETIRDVVALKPHRAALHDLIVALSTRFRIKDHKELKEKVETLHKSITLHLLEIRKDVFRTIERNAKSAAEQYENDRNTDGLPDLAKQRLVKITQHAEWNDLPETARQRIQRRVIINTILREMIEAATADIVQKILDNKHMQHQFGLRSLENHAPENRQAFLVTGGPAVGKGRVVKAIESGGLGIKPADLAGFSKNNPDYYKEILLSPDDLGPYLPYYGSLTHPESFLISDKICLAWKKMAEAGSAPNILMDTARPHPWVMDIFAAGQSPVHILMTTCDVERALERNYARGLKTKRFMPTKTLLTFHQCEPDMLETAIAQHDPIVSLIDTNGAEPVLAAVRQQGREFEIYSDDTWQDFQKSRAINPHAVNAGQLYSKKSGINFESPTLI